MTFGQWSALLNAYRTEISSALPAWVKAMFLGQPMATPLVFNASTRKITTQRDGIHIPDTLLRTDVHGLETLTPQNVDILLPEKELLRREITVPTKSLSKLDQVIGLDTIQKTPFKPADIYSTTQVVSTNGSVSKVEQWIARRDHVETVRSRLAALGLNVRRVYVGEAALADFSNEVAPRARHWRAINALLILATVGLLSLWFLAPSWGSFQALQKQEIINSSLSKEAMALRQRVDGLQVGASERAAFIARVSQRQTVSSILRDLTVLMPDDVWLTDISIQNGRVVIRGSTAGSAAELVLSLTEDQRFLSPRLTGPVSQTADGRERFDMTLGLKGYDT